MSKLTKQYTVIIEQDEDGFFVASVPALPGCYTQAKTMALLKERVREAILLCLELAKNDRAYQNLLKNFAYQPSFVGLETIAV